MSLMAKAHYKIVVPMRSVINAALTDPVSIEVDWDRAVDCRHRSFKCSEDTNDS